MNTILRNARQRSWPFVNLSSEFQRELSAMRRTQDPNFHGNRGVYPPVNLVETEEGFTLTAELPGVAPGDIDISIEGATVTLAGQRKIEHVAGDGTTLHRRERQSGIFRRAFELPVEIDLDSAKASHKDGVLTLRLPTSPALQPRQIEIETR